MQNKTKELYEIALFLKDSQHYSMAYDILEDLAMTGYVPAYFQIAEFLDLGIGTKQDIEMSAYFYLKAADAGDVRAQYAIALKLFWGIGIERNWEAAARYFQLCRSEFKSADKLLRVMYNR